MAFAGFDNQLVAFLRELRTNNNRDWFQANKLRYEEHVQGPMLEFVSAMESRLKKVSPYFRADPKKVGGSMMRIYRDVRFSKDKTPYHTFVAVHFRHKAGKSCTAPGLYVRIDAESAGVGAGLWHPDNQTLTKIRKRIDRDSKAWKSVTSNRRMRDTFGGLDGESLKRPPKGYAADHPLVDDLRRKDFIVGREMPVKAALGKSFPDRLVKDYVSAKPLVKFLCEAVGVEM